MQKYIYFTENNMPYVSKKVSVNEGVGDNMTPDWFVEGAQRKMSVLQGRTEGCCHKLIERVIKTWIYFLDKIGF